MLTEDIVRTLKKTVRRAVRNIVDPNVTVYHGSPNADQVRQHGLSRQAAQQSSRMSYFGTHPNGVFVTTDKQYANRVATGQKNPTHDSANIVAMKIRKSMLKKGTQRSVEWQGQTKSHEAIFNHLSKRRFV